MCVCVRVCVCVCACACACVRVRVCVCPLSHAITVHYLLSPSLHSLPFPPSSQAEADKELLAELEQVLGDGAELDDGQLLACFRRMLVSMPCRNQGYVLDGFPLSDEAARELFDITEEDETGDAEESGVEQKLPEFVFALDAEDEPLKERVRELTQEEAEALTATETGVCCCWGLCALSLFFSACACVCKSSCMTLLLFIYASTIYSHVVSVLNTMCCTTLSLSLSFAPVSLVVCCCRSKSTMSA